MVQGLRVAPPEVAEHLGDIILTQTHTHTLSLTHTHAHSHTLSLYLSLSLGIVPPEMFEHLGDIILELERGRRINRLLCLGGVFGVDAVLISPARKQIFDIVLKLERSRSINRLLRLLKNGVYLRLTRANQG